MKTTTTEAVTPLDALRPDAHEALMRTIGGSLDDPWRSESFPVARFLVEQSALGLEIPDDARLRERFNLSPEVFAEVKRELSGTLGLVGDTWHVEDAAFAALQWQFRCRKREMSFAQFIIGDRLLDEHVEARKIGDPPPRLVDDTLAAPYDIPLQTVRRALAYLRKSGWMPTLVDAVVRSGHDSA